MKENFSNCLKISRPIQHSFRDCSSSRKAHKISRILHHVFMLWYPFNYIVECFILVAHSLARRCAIHSLPASKIPSIFVHEHPWMEIARLITFPTAAFVAYREKTPINSKCQPARDFLVPAIRNLLSAYHII